MIEQCTVEAHQDTTASFCDGLSNLTILDERIAFLVPALPGDYGWKIPCHITVLVSLDSNQALALKSQYFSSNFLSSINILSHY